MNMLMISCEPLTNTHLAGALRVLVQPYLWGLTRSVVEAGIAKVKTLYPNTPTYITFGQHCFDPSAACGGAGLPGSSRGVPQGLDLLGFDWYSDGECDGSPATLEEQFQCHVVSLLVICFTSLVGRGGSM
jgi:hypothetical protein